MIRDLSPGDLPGVRAVIDSVGLFPSEMMDVMAAPYLAGEADEVWRVADEGGVRAVLYAAPERMTQGTWTCLLVAVHAGAQARGLGRALMESLEADLAGRGAHLLLVETSGDAAFEGARGFYRGLGYAEEARILDFYQPGEDKVVFRLRLGA